MRYRLAAILIVVLGCSDPPGAGGPDAGVDSGDPDAAVVVSDAAPIPDDIREYLDTVPGMTVVEELDPELPGYRFFVLEYEQPADHADLDGVWFAQRLTLLHTDRDAPMVLATSGYYGSMRPRRTEPARLLEANQIYTEQRFFLPSRPDPADWGDLNIEQGAGDHHRIVEALRPYYAQGAWIATGASKGGMTSVYHRRFYPDDLDGVVAYVAPISFGMGDARYVTFLDEVGDAGCRQALSDLQRELLLRRDAMKTRIAATAEVDGYTFEIVGGLDGALESAVIELPFSFWQYQDASLCTDLPGGGATDDVLYDWLDQISGVVLSSDQGVWYYRPYYHQAFTQLGYPGIDTSNIDDLLIAPDVPVEAYLEPGVDTTFDETAMPDVADWVRTEGSELLFIYGEHDPWTAGAFELGGAEDSYLYVAPGGNHGSGIRDLRGADRDEVYATLERWTGVTPMFRELAPGEPRELRLEPRIRLAR